MLKPSSLGDVVHTLPAVALLKQLWPQSRLRWLINPEWAPLLDGNPHVDEIVLFPRREFRGLRGWVKIAPWARALRSKRAELVLDFQGLLRTALIARLVRDGEVLGLSDAREGARLFYDRVVDVSGVAHAVDRYLRIVAALDAPITGPLEWPLPAGASPEGFSAAAPFILLHPFARGAGKSLSAEDVSELCRGLAPHRVVLAGRSEQSVGSMENVENFLNRTSLPELIWLIRRAAFVVSVDSGPMHIAAALTPRLLAIHTWSDPAKVGPYNREAWIWKSGGLFQKANAAAPQPAPDLASVAAFLRKQIAP